MKASLKEKVSEPPAGQRWLLKNVSLAESISEPLAEQRGHIVRTTLNNKISKQPSTRRGLLMKAADFDAYGVNKEFIKRACSEFARRSP